MTPKFFPLLRVMAVVQAAAFLVQAVTAGQLLSSPGGRALHAATAIAALAVGEEWKDTVELRDAQTVEIIARFSGYRGRYVFHCHNLEHEDMAMMATFEVV